MTRQEVQAFLAKAEARLKALRFYEVPGAELRKFTKDFSDQKIEPVKLKDGRFVLPATLTTTFGRLSDQEKMDLSQKSVVTNLTTAEFDWKT